MRVQSERELDEFYATPDPWGYFSNAHDRSRKEILLAELSQHTLGRVLDIGCGNGFITEGIVADDVIGVDLSASAILEARDRSTSAVVRYVRGSLFDLPFMDMGRFDTVLITGVLYEQYIGRSLPLVYQIVDELLGPGGLLVSVHIESWYFARFPYPLLKSIRYRYREYGHVLETFRK